MKRCLYSITMDDNRTLTTMIDECIEEYKVFLSDSLSLDSAGIQGKYRPLVLESPAYRMTTRQIRARKFKEEIVEIDNISKRLKDYDVDDDTDEDDADSGNDPFDLSTRLGKKKKPAANTIKADKDILSMRFKASDLMRGLQNLNKMEDEAEENTAVNVFFIELTAKEFEDMETTEVFHNRADVQPTDDVFAGMGVAAGKEMPDAVRQTIKQLREPSYADEEDGFIEHEDGTIEEL